MRRFEFTATIRVSGSFFEDQETTYMKTKEYLESVSKEAAESITDHVRGSSSIDRCAVVIEEIRGMGAPA